jgi:hypothetical protein
VLCLCLSSCLDRKEGDFLTLTSVPPVDLRRDELPYLRMGKALGDLSVRPQGKGASDSLEKRISFSEMAPFSKERWENIVAFVQKKYPLRSLKGGFLETEWVNVKDASDMLFSAQVNLDAQSARCDVKVFVRLDSDCDIDTDQVRLIRKKIASDILSIDRAFCQKRQSKKE